ncbi:3-hydroxyacyl-CoA dehydrogenase family protein [Ureibacillus sp. MALMAid1270]|uniref:3-hydroxyacyl-CoA dehydrogenase family protein n=1 Tax=Ureibacillus sp. MALMAid1270 TaxID=3411629 RepID=UPI003BA7E7DC
MEKITVLGAGTMGHDIAQLFAQAGFEVSLYDIHDQFLNQALTRISSNLDLLIESNSLTPVDKEKTLQQISQTTNLVEAVDGTSFIIEAVSENLKAKFDLFKQLEEVINEDVIIASNTSTFSIQQLAEGLQHRNRLIITHFFNPAHLVPLVEVVKSPETPQEIIDRALEILKLIGKQPVILKKDVPGLIANRLQAALVREAFYLVSEGVADGKDIDLAITAGPGFRWAFIGPLETADFGGLDIWKSVVENLSPVLSKDEKVPAFIEEKVQKGELGTKTGCGLFIHDAAEVAKRIRERDENFIQLTKLKKKQLD